MNFNDQHSPEDGFSRFADSTIKKQTSSSASYFLRYFDESESAALNFGPRDYKHRDKSL